MAATSTFRYFAREAIREIWDRRAVSMLSMATIAASLYIVGLFTLGARGVESLLAHWSNELSVSIFIGETTTGPEVEAIRAKIAASPETASFEYLDRAAALERFKRDFPDQSDLPGVLDANPFPASFEVRMKPEAGSPDAIAAFAQSFSGMAGVSDVRFDALWVEKLRSILRAAGIGGLAIGCVLLGAAILTISAVVRMGVYARRDEIEILKLVGATAGFIRAPFLIEGAMQGLVGGAAALAGIVATAFAFSGSAGELTRSLVGQALGTTPRLLDGALLLLAGALIGLFGSVLAAARDANLRA